MGPSKPIVWLNDNLSPMKHNLKYSNSKMMSFSLTTSSAAKSMYPGRRIKSLKEIE